MHYSAESRAIEAPSFSEGQSPTGISYRIYEAGSSHAKLPLVMVMGYGGSMFSWPLSFIEKLAARRQVIIFDNRGTGRSGPLKAEQSLRMHNLAEDLLELLESLALGKVDIFGYSMGGCITLELARINPETVGRLVLQSSTAGGRLYTSADQDVKERMANPRGKNFDEMLFDFFDLCMTVSAMEKNRAVLNAICENARPYPTPPRVLMPQLDAFRHFDASAYLEKIKSPALVLHGKDDRILKVPNGQKLAEALPQAKQLIFESCGHCPHIEYEEMVLEALEDFLC